MNANQYIDAKHEHELHLRHVQLKRQTLNPSSADCTRVTVYQSLNSLHSKWSSTHQAHSSLTHTNYDVTSTTVHSSPPKAHHPLSLSSTILFDLSNYLQHIITTSPIIINYPSFTTPSSTMFLFKTRHYPLQAHLHMNSSVLISALQSPHQHFIRSSKYQHRLTNRIKLPLCHWMSLTSYDLRFFVNLWR